MTTATAQIPKCSSCGLLTAQTGGLCNICRMRDQERRIVLLNGLVERLMKEVADLKARNERLEANLEDITIFAEGIADRCRRFN
jgi:hypothetical protein